MEVGFQSLSAPGFPRDAEFMIILSISSISLLSLKVKSVEKQFNHCPYNLKILLEVLIVWPKNLYVCVARAVRFWI